MASISKFCLAIVVGIGCADFAAGQQLRRARVTQVVQDVKLLPKEATARPAVINDEVNQDTAVRTGSDSRSELTFTDLTITRLGANTVFSFNRETRELRLSNGAALIQIPPAAPELKVSNATVSAAISGGTAIFDAATGKFMVLEGEGRMWPLGHPEQALKIHAGNMVWLTAGGHVSTPKTFDVKLVMKTSRLITGFAPLPNLDLIMQVIDGQQAAIAPTPPIPIFQDIISQKVAASTQPEIAPPPPPIPGEFGSPQTISSPAPYGIDSSAVINTDPTITKNGVTDFGTIYRNQTQDGPLGAWAFGSTSTFDTASNFNSNANPSFENVAVFKFQSLELNGPPTISTQGGATRLGLIAVDGITSGDAGGTFTFPSLDFMFLATENGPINLGSGITFEGLNRLLLYARGSNGNMTLSSQFNNIGNLNLNAEGTIEVNGAAISHNGGNIALLSGVTSGMAIQLQSNSKLFSLLSSEAGSGGTISITTRGGDIIANGQIEADHGTINISNSVPSGFAQSSLLQLSAARPTIVLGGSLTAEIINVSSAGDLNIGTASPVSIDAVTLTLQARGTLTWAGSLLLPATNTDSNASVNISAGDAINIQNGVAISRSSGGTVNGMNVSFSAGTDLLVQGPITISLAPNLIDSGGNTSLAAGGSIAVDGPMSLNTEVMSNLSSGGNISVSSTGGNVSAQTIQAGIKIDTAVAVTSGANLSLSASGDIMTTSPSHTDGIVLSVNSSNGGRILNGGGVSVMAGGNVTTSGPLALSIDNASGGTIGSNAVVSLTAANVSADSFSEIINNPNTATIGGNASIVLNLSGDLTSTGPGVMNFRILNYGNVDGLPGGKIDGSAVIAVTAANITANSLVADMDGEGGMIGGNTTITFNISGKVKVTTNADFHIEQAEPPGGSASTASAADAITFNGGSYQIGGLFRTFVNSRDGTIAFNNANVHADVLKVETLGSDGVLRIGGGSLNANTLLRLYAPGSNGVIDFVANVTLSSQGAAAVIAANTVTIENNVVVTITGAGGTALVYTNHPNYTGFGGNGTTSGTFAGNGAITGPLNSAPPFDGQSSRVSSAVTTVSTSTQGAGGGETRPLKGRRTSFAAPKGSAVNPARRSPVAPRLGLRMADSTALLDLVADTASDGFSLANHARSKLRNAQRNRPENSHDRSRPESSRRTFSASRDRIGIAKTSLPKP